MFEINLFMPEIIITIAACSVLIVDLFINKRRAGLLFFVSITALLLAAVSSLELSQISASFFEQQFVLSPLLQSIKFFSYISLIVVLTYNYSYVKKHKLATGEYYSLILFSLLGVQVLIGAGNLLTIYLGLELLTLPLYALVAIDKQPTSSEAAMKYFVLGAIASSIFLFGSSLLFGLTGELGLSAIAGHLSGAANPVNLMLENLAIVLVLSGLLFKLGAVPFHLWLPDVYQGSRTPITQYIATIPKLAALAMGLNLISLCFVHTSEIWHQLLLVFALASIALGNVIAIMQTNLKRMLAYSAISHIGFVILALLLATNASMSVAVYYVVAYIFMLTGVFGCILLLSEKADINEISQLKGLATYEPYIAGLLLIFIFSLAGIPPLAGFFAKLLILKELVAAGYYFTSLFALVFSVVGAFYYLRIIKVMYFDKAEKVIDFSYINSLKLLLILNAILIIILGIMPSLLLNLI